MGRGGLNGFRAFTIAAFTIASSGSLVARAEASSAHLRWADDAESARLGCISIVELEEQIEAVLGRNAITNAESADVTLTVQVEVVSRSFLAILTLAARDGALLGVRTIEHRGDACDVLEGSLVVVAAMMVDLRELESRLDLRPLDPPETGPSEGGIIPELSPPPQESWRVSIWGAGTASYGLVPGFAGNISFGALARPPGFWPLELSADFFPETGTSGSEGVAVLAATASFAICAPLDGEGWALGLCAGGSGGILRGRGFGFASVREDIRGYGDVRALLNLGVRLVEPLWLVFRVGVAVPFVHVEFVGEIDGVRFLLHEPAWVVPLGSLGLAVQIS
jgi:hypothetical protein